MRLNTDENIQHSWRKVGLWPLPSTTRVWTTHLLGENYSWFHKSRRGPLLSLRVSFWDLCSTRGFSGLTVNEQRRSQRKQLRLWLLSHDFKHAPTSTKESVRVMLWERLYLFLSYILVLFFFLFWFDMRTPTLTPLYTPDPPTPESLPFCFKFKQKLKQS